MLAGKNYGKSSPRAGLLRRTPNGRETDGNVTLVRPLPRLSASVGIDEERGMHDVMTMLWQSRREHVDDPLHQRRGHHEEPRKPATAIGVSGDVVNRILFIRARQQNWLSRKR